MKSSKVRTTSIRMPIGRAKDLEKHKAEKERLKNIEKMRKDFYY